MVLTMREHGDRLDQRAIVGVWPRCSTSATNSIFTGHLPCAVT